MYSSSADRKWPDEFTCNKSNGTKVCHLSSRPRIFERSVCGQQHSIAAGTVFHTAWPMCHKLRHAQTGDHPDCRLEDLIVVDEAFYGGRKQKENCGRGQAVGRKTITDTELVARVTTAGTQ